LPTDFFGNGRDQSQPAVVVAVEDLSVLASPLTKKTTGIVLFGARQVSQGQFHLPSNDNVGSGEDIRRSHAPNVKVMNRNNLESCWQ